MKEVKSAQRQVLIVESLDLIDALYGITEQDREILDVIRGFKDIKISGKDIN